MITNVNVLRSIIHHLILDKVNRTLIITRSIDVLWRQCDLIDKLVQPNCFIFCLWFCNIYSFREWQRHILLKNRYPTNVAICKSENIPVVDFFLFKSPWSTSTYSKSDLAFIALSNSLPCWVESLRLLSIYFITSQCILLGVNMYLLILFTTNVTFGHVHTINYIILSTKLS